MRFRYRMTQEQADELIATAAAAFAMLTVFALCMTAESIVA